jgi:hypothetical protein
MRLNCAAAQKLVEARMTVVAAFFVQGMLSRWKPPKKMGKKYS